MSGDFQWKVLFSYPERSLELAWRQFLTQADFPVGLAMPEYLQEEERASKRFAVLALSGTTVEGVLTGLDGSSRVSSGLPVRPQVCCRISADKAQVALALSAGLSEVGKGAELIAVHTWTPMEGFEAAGYRMRPFSGNDGIIVLDLTEGPDRLFAGFSQTRRNEVRRAIKLGLEVSEPTSERDLEEYYAIVVRWCERKGTAAGSYESAVRPFERRELRRLFLAKREGKVLAGSVFRTCPGGIVEYVANFSVPESLEYKPNGLLVWRAVEWAHKEGFRLMSLGAAHPFLQRFGGRNLTTYRYQQDRTLLRRHELKESLARFRTRLARRLPVGARKAIKRLLGMHDS